MPTYTPNVFSGQMAQANALRSYTPNYFARQGGGGNTSGALAPHLSVAAADRPYAADVALLQGADAPGFNATTLDKYWRYSPHTYQTKVGKLLQPLQATLAELRNPPINYDDPGLPAGYERVLDEDGNYVVRRLPDYEGGGD